MLSFDELAGTLRSTKDRLLQGIARSPGVYPSSHDSEEVGGAGSGAKDSQTKGSQADEVSGSSVDASKPRDNSSSQESGTSAVKTVTPSNIQKQEVEAPPVGNQDTIVSPIR